MDLLEWKHRHYKDNEFIVLYGSSSGIGFEYLKLLAEVGMNIIAISNEKARLDVQTVELAKRYNIKIESLYCDLTNIEEIKSITDYLSKKAIVGAVINAGFGLKKLTNNDKMILVKDIVTLSSIGPSMILQAVLPKLQQRNRGLVINVSSPPQGNDPVCTQVHKASKAFWKSLCLSFKNENRASNIYFQLVLPKAKYNEINPNFYIQYSARTARGSVNALHKIVYSSNLLDRLIPYFS